MRFFSAYTVPHLVLYIYWHTLTRIVSIVQQVIIIEKLYDAR